MTDKPIIDDRFEHTLRQDAELDALRRMLDASQGTCSLSLAVCNSPALRDFVIRKISAEKSNVVKIQLDQSVTDVFDFVDQQVSSKQPQALFIINMESALPSQQKEYKILQNLNFSRERWKARLACPLVFWLPEYAAALISIHARDLYSWISHHFEFVSEQASAQMGMQDQYAGDTLAASSLTLEQKQFRIAELEQRITDAGDPPHPKLTNYCLIWRNELACLYKFIGELDHAEDMHNKSLEIEKKLGRLEGQADHYGNLGLIYRTRGDLDRAEEMLKKSLEINMELGRLEGQAADYGNLGLIYRTRGELDRAENIHQKALKIYLNIGKLEGQANQYGNLGHIYQTRSDLKQTRSYWIQARDIFQQIGMPHRVKQIDDYLNDLPPGISRPYKK